ncbi:MAG: ECF transporter S component [Euryarchaeota archaeon]|nr:ECF transporter S component [Euryarchaeota archaeon]
MDPEIRIITFVVFSLLVYALMKKLTKKKISSKEVAMLGIFTALTAIATMFLRIPISATGGYFNFGETIIYTAAFLFGSYTASFVGGIGSAIADLWGFPFFAPITLVVKAVEGYLVGRIYEKKHLPFGKKTDRRIKIFAGAVGGTFMVIGYFIGEIFIYKMIGGESISIQAAAIEVPINILQMVSGITLATIITEKIKLPHEWQK